MRHALSNEAWKNLLPDSVEWLDKVAVTATGGTADGAHHVIAARAGGDDAKDSIVLDAPKLPEAQRSKLEAAAKALGWRPSAGALHLSVDGFNATLVPVNTTRAPERQLARQLGLDAAKATKELKVAHLALCASDKLAALDVLDGYTGGLYNHVGFKGARKRDSGRFPGKISLAGASASAEDIRRQLQMARAQAFVRFLQDAPPNYMNPLKLAEVAKDMARDAGLKCKVLDKEQMTALGMGSFLSVSDGGATEPRTIVIEIDGQDNSRCVALVGKGLTFDSGGISLKPGAGMEEMKYDMSGGAAVLGAALYLAAVKPPTKVVCLVGATENMPQGSATKPGDIVRAMNGKTIEVLNTDAEGRLVLADVLHYAITEFKPELVVDIATLTGAVLMALGTVGSAIMANDAGAAQQVLKAAEAVGEPMWQLPLWPELEKEVKSDVADLKNIAKPNVKGGSIMGGMFLKEFVGDAKWVHMDIAGTGWNTLAVGYPNGGGSAFGMRTMIATCLRLGG
jgi:leucyl aminopeptidase